MLDFEDFGKLTDEDLKELFEDIDNKKIKSASSLNTEQICTNCETDENLINDISQGIIVCSNCGLVIGNIEDKNADFGKYDDETKCCRDRGSITINTLLPQSSLGSTIKGNYSRRINIIQTWNKMPYKERSLNNVFKIIQAKCHLGGIPKCVEDDAKIMFKMLSECKHTEEKSKGKTKIFRGKNRSGLIAACLFFACRKNGKTRTPKEIAKIFSLKYPEITRGCNGFMKLMKIKKSDLDVGLSQPEHFVVRYCNELNIKSFYSEQAIRIARNIHKLNVATVHTPVSIAIGSIMLMIDENNLNKTITRKQLSEMFQVSEVTMTKIYRKIEKDREAFLNDSVADEILKITTNNPSKDSISKLLVDRFKKFEIEIPTTVEIKDNDEPKISVTNIPSKLRKAVKNIDDYFVDYHNFDEFMKSFV